MNLTRMRTPTRSHLLSHSLSYSLLALSPVFRRGYALHYSMYFDRQSGTRRVLCATKLLLLLLRRFVSVCNSYTYVCMCTLHTPSCSYGIWNTYRYVYGQLFPNRRVYQLPELPPNNQRTVRSSCDVVSRVFN